MTAKIGYAAMLERFHPREATRLSALAEQHGFSGVMATDHFQPWLPRHGQAGFVWSVLAAIAECTSGEIGPVTTPGYRMHPAAVAQASATLAALHPGRHWLGIGSGEALNEHVVGEYWPEVPERFDRMFEAIELIRRLFSASLSGRDTRYSGAAFRLESTRLWTMPEVPPPIMVATSGPTTARRAGRLADGIITKELPPERMELLLRRFDEGARDAGRDVAKLRKAVQLHVSWAPTRAEAERSALEEWPVEALRSGRWDLRSPYDFDQLSRNVRQEDLIGKVFVSEDLDAHRAHLQRYVDLGFSHIYVHNAGLNQAEWIEAFGREVLPGVAR